MESFPLSPMQHGMLFHHLTDRHSGVDVEQLVCSLHDDLDLLAFENAWQHVLALHPSLRIGFRWRGTTEPLQTISENLPLPLIVHDWQSWPASGRQRRFDEFLAADRRQGFELDKPPLMRLTLFRLAPREYRLVWTFHHIIADGRSHPIVLDDVFDAYEHLLRGDDAPIRRPRPYADYIQWLQQQDFTKSETFWRHELEGFTEPTRIEVGTDDRSRNVAERHPEHVASLSEADTAALRALAGRHDLTMNTVVQGAWALLLGRYSDTGDVVFGATRACRHWSREGTNDIVGLFINTLPVRVAMSPDEPLIPWLQALRRRQHAVRDHEHTPLVRVQGWSNVPRGTSLFETIVVYDSYFLDSRMKQLGGEWNHRDFQLLEQTGFPLSLYAYGESELRLKLVFDREKFERATVERMLDQLGQLLRGMASGPESRLGELSLLTDVERKQILVKWNDTDRALADDPCIHRAFERRAAESPGSIAVVHRDTELTYGDLNARANRLARHLRAHGVGPDVCVAIHMDRSPDVIVAMLAVLKAGGAYVPLDPAYPARRLALVLDDCKAPVVLTRGALLDSLPEHSATVLCVDLERDSIARLADEDLEDGPAGHDLAYVVYTSGSTGQPKGVMVEHRNVTNFFAGMDDVIDPGPERTWLAVTSVAFDISVLELLWTLARGFKVVLFDFPSASPHPAAANTLTPTPDGDTLPDLIRQRSVTHLQCTPSMARALILDRDWLDSLGSLEALLLGGEALAPSLVERLRTVVTGRIHNMYGPTETTVWSSAHPVAGVDAAAGSVPIGRPIANTRLYVLDRHLQPVPVGVSGELYIGGRGVARGYFGRPELTRSTFVADPFSGEADTRLYRTGDRVRWAGDGTLEFIGRMDNQVKIRGYRIELGEIETTLEKHPAVREAVVVAREDTPDDLRLVAYLVPASADRPATHELREFTKDTLPDFMVPSAFVSLNGFPLTPNGKVDRLALPAPDALRPDLSEAYVAPRSHTERQLGQLWSQVLGIDSVGLHDNFFEMGGHSLSAVQVVNRIRDSFGVEMPLQNFFNAPSLASLAQKVDLAKVERTLKEISFPTRFAVEVCADCNLACSMCHHPQMRRPKGRMPFQLWTRCADQIADVSPATQCWFSFCGEPFLEPELLFKMLAYGKSAGLRSLNINTNGMLLTPDLAGPVLDSGVDLIVIGIDGMTSDTYEKIRVGGNRDRLYANIEHLLAARHALASGPEIQVQFIEMEENQHELEEFKSYWLDRGAVVKARRMLSWGGFLETSLCVPEEERIPCPWALTMMHVFWDGRVPRCPGDTEGEEGVGNAWDAPLSDLWGQLGVYRGKHLKRQFGDLPVRCQSCTDWMTGSAERLQPQGSRPPATG